jgi:putative endonuclease
MESCAVYFLTNRHQTVLYVGVTSDLRKRLAEHLAGFHPSSFTHKYNVDRLVYFELTADIRAAIAREKQIKRWSRWKKVALIEAVNPHWRDLGEDVRAEVLSGDSSTRRRLAPPRSE